MSAVRQQRRRRGPAPPAQEQGEAGEQEGRQNEVAEVRRRRDRRARVIPEDRGVPGLAARPAEDAEADQRPREPLAAGVPTRRQAAGGTDEQDHDVGPAMEERAGGERRREDRLDLVQNDPHDRHERRDAEEERGPDAGHTSAVIGAAPRPLRRRDRRV